MIFITPSYNFKEVVGLVMGAEMARINNEKKNIKRIYTSPNNTRTLVWAVDIMEVGSGRWEHCVGTLLAVETKVAGISNQKTIKNIP